MKKIIAIIAIVLLVSSSAWAGPKITRGGGSAAGTGSVATDTIWDTAGDMVYGTGSNTAQKLAIGTAYQLLMTNAGATAPEWTYTLGATGTRLTKGWFTDLEITNAPTINGAAWTTILQPLNAGLTSLAGLTETAGGIPYGTASNTYAWLAAGTAGYILKMGASYPEWSNSLSLATLDMTSATSSVPWPVGTSSYPTAEGGVKWNGSTDALYIGDGATSIILDLTANATYTFPAATASLAPLASPTFTTEIILPSTNADPSATAGALRHDSTISNFTNGGLVYYNGAAIKQLVDMTTATASACTDDQVVAYDADNDLWYCKDDANSGSATALDDVADPDADTTISVAGYETTITSTLDEANHSVLTIINTDADRANDTTLLTLSDNDSADANAFFIKMIADADGTPATVFSVTGLATTIASTDVSITGTQFRLPSTDADPTATAGYIRHDSSNTNADTTARGVIVWHDGTNARTVIDSGTSYTTVIKTEFIPIAYMVDGSAAPGDLTTHGSTKYRDFAYDSTKDVKFMWAAPAELVGATVKVRAIGLVTDATAPANDEGVSWGISAASSGTSDSDDPSRGTVVYSKDADLDNDCNARYDYCFFPYVEVTPTDLAAGEMVAFTVIRKHDDSDDDYAKAMGLVGVEIKYKTKVLLTDTW